MNGPDRVLPWCGAEPVLAVSAILGWPRCSTSEPKNCPLWDWPLRHRGCAGDHVTRAKRQRMTLCAPGDWPAVAVPGPGQLAVAWAGVPCVTGICWARLSAPRTKTSEAITRTETLVLFVFLVPHSPLVRSLLFARVAVDLFSTHSRRRPLLPSPTFFLCVLSLRHRNFRPRTRPAPAGMPTR